MQDQFRDSWVARIQEQVDRNQRKREADDMLDWHTGESDEITAFLEDTTPDAPGGVHKRRPVVEKKAAVPTANSKRVA